MLGHLVSNGVHGISGGPARTAPGLLQWLRALFFRR